MNPIKLILNLIQRYKRHRYLRIERDVELRRWFTQI
jgi:hypothetical protein